MVSLQLAHRHSRAQVRRDGCGATMPGHRHSTLKSRLLKSSHGARGEQAHISFSTISSDGHRSHYLNLRIIFIAAGRDHLLGLTSSGRTFMHPITKNANSYGQLGFRKFECMNACSTLALDIGTPDTQCLTLNTRHPNTRLRRR